MVHHVHDVELRVGADAGRGEFLQRLALFKEVELTVDQLPKPRRHGPEVRRGLQRREGGERLILDVAPEHGHRDGGGWAPLALLRADRPEQHAGAEARLVHLLDRARAQAAAEVAQPSADRGRQVVVEGDH